MKYSIILITGHSHRVMRDCNNYINTIIDIKINLHAKTGRRVKSNINYTLIHKKKNRKSSFFLKLNILEIRYSLVTLYKD